MKRKILVGLLTIVVCFVLVGCGKTDPSKEIVGKWKNDTEGYKFIYTFNADGTGEYDAAGSIMKFKYTIDGDKISFKYLEQEENMTTMDTTFSIDGDTLNIKDSNNEDTLYERVK